jgi:recombination protein RecT
MSEAANNTVAPMPKRVHHGKLSEVKSLQDAFDHPAFLARIHQATPRHLSPDRMLSVFIQSVSKTPKLRECNIMSLLGAFVALASIGLEPNTPLGHAYLVPFEKRKRVEGKWVTERVDVQVIIGYQGLLDLSYRSDQLSSVHADVVWAAEAKSRENWDFHYGTGGRLFHRPMGAPRDEHELPVWAYMHANMKSGGEAFEVMPIADVLKIRDATQAYRAAIAAKRRAEEENWRSLPPAYTEAPWIRYPVAMYRKTVFRQGSKWLPKSIELARALALDEAGDRGAVEFGRVIEGSVEDALENALPAPETNFWNAQEFGNDDGYGQVAETRGAAEAPQKPAEATKPAQARPGPGEHVMPSQRQPAAPQWQHYLVDPDGEIVADVFEQPQAWANAYAALFEREQDVARRKAMAEHNADAIDALPEPARLIVEDARTGTVGGGDPAERMEIAKGPRGPDVNAWLKLAGAVLNGLDVVDVMRWVQQNAPVYLPLPHSKRLELAKLVAARCKALGIDTVPLMQPPGKQPSAAEAGQLPLGDQPAPFEAQRWADVMTEKVGQCTDMDTLKALADAAGPYQARVEAVNKAIWGRVQTVFQAKKRYLQEHPPS